MTVSRVRCVSCRAYVPRDGVYYRSRTSNVCTEVCFREYYEKQRVKSAERKPAKRKNTSRLDPDLRQIVRRRDGGSCRWCGKTGEQLHHIVYRSQQGLDEASNLILLCQEHHMMAHSNKRRWQPVLLGLIWRGYVEGVWLTVPDMERWLLSEGIIEELQAA